MESCSAQLDSHAQIPRWLVVSRLVGPSISSIYFFLLLASSKTTVDFDFVLESFASSNILFQIRQLITLLVQLPHLRPPISLKVSFDGHSPFCPSVMRSSYGTTGSSMFRICYVFRWITDTGHFPESRAVKTILIVSSPVILTKTPLKRSLGSSPASLT